MLSLKALHAELEQLKSNNLNSQTQATQGAGVNTDSTGNQKIITRLYKQSSFFLFWLLGVIITYAHKIPFVSKIVTVLSMWYGRTSWWQLLVKLSKIFVILNALIGVITVFYENLYFR